MLKMEMRFNGRKITSSSQLDRELMRSIERRVEDSLRRATSAWRIRAYFTRASLRT